MELWLLILIVAVATTDGAEQEPRAVALGGVPSRPDPDPSMR